MATAVYAFERLSTKKGFNESLKHFQAVSSLLSDFEDRYNLADLLNAMIAKNEIENEQLHSIVYALLVDKYGYSYKSYNMKNSLENFENIHNQIKTWKAVDIVLAYYHPELGLTLINPKNKTNWESLNQIKRDEPVVVYAGCFADSPDKKSINKAIDLVIQYLEGRKTKAPASFTSGKYGYRKVEIEEEKPWPKKTPARKPRAKAGRPAAKRAEPTAPVRQNTPSAPQQPAPKPTGKMRMTPMYSVNVTNELFHNGNVEAWKKIIESYKAKHPSLEVYIFYDGERIHDINTLFKWGKVKHGSPILFAVTGDEIKDVAKLQRYLFQGASNRFEDFLRFPVNTVLSLF